MTKEMDQLPHFGGKEITGKILRGKPKETTSSIVKIQRDKIGRNIQTMTMNAALRAGPKADSTFILS